MIEIHYYCFTALIENWHSRIICLSHLHMLILGTWNKGDTSAIVYIVLLLLDFISFSLCGGFGCFSYLIYEKVLIVFSVEGLLVLVFLTWYTRKSWLFSASKVCCSCIKNNSEERDQNSFSEEGTCTCLFTLLKQYCNFIVFFF